MNKCGVSICISAYKAKEYIKETIDSVVSQDWFITHNNYEIIIGVDGCVETLEYLKTIMSLYDNYNLKILMMDSNKGTFITSNTIIKQAKYNYVIRFDSDDIMHSDMVSVLVEHMDNNTNCGMARFYLHNFPEKLIDESHPKKHITYGATILRHNIIDEFGWYKPWICGADSELIERIKNVIRIDTVDNILMERRISDNSLTVRKETNFKSKIREQYKKEIANLNIKCKDDAKIECVTNTFKTIYDSMYSDIIVSFTTYTKRVNTVYKVIDSINKNSIKPSKIILNLSKVEFPNEINDLPYSLIKENNVEFYFLEDNNKAYKKIIPTLNRFPNAIIISIDDDIIYPTDFIKNLLFEFNNTKQNYSISLSRLKNDWEGGIESHVGAATITKKQFFGKYLNELYNNFCLNILKEKYTDLFPFDDLVFTYSLLLNGKKHIRCNKYNFNAQSLAIKETQNEVITNQKDNKSKLDSLHKKYRKYIKEKYNVEYDDLVKNIKGENNKIIVSFTSYKQRLCYAHLMVKSLLENTMKPYKIIMTLYNEDTKYITDELKEYIDNGQLEIIKCDIDIRPHKKYFYVMQKYKEYPIITVDDDVYYSKDLIKSLYDAYIKNPNCICGRRARIITYNEDGTAKNYKQWPLNNTLTQPVTNILFTGVGGVLYPPNAFELSDKNIKDIYKYITVDDMYLYYLAMKNGYKNVWVWNEEREPKEIKEVQKYGLYNNENKPTQSENNPNDIAIKELINERLIKGNELIDSEKKNSQSIQNEPWYLKYQQLRQDTNNNPRESKNPHSNQATTQNQKLSRVELINSMSKKRLVEKRIKLRSKRHI